MSYVSSRWPLVSEYVYLLAGLANPCYRRLLRYISVYSTSAEPTYGLYCNYAERTFITVSRKERIFWLGQQSRQGQYVQGLGYDDLRFRARTAIDSSQIVPSTVFHSQVLGQTVVWFWGIFRRCFVLGSPSQADK